MCLDRVSRNGLGWWRELIVGLGNPGIHYQFSPHNVGFLAVDRIASNLGVEVRNRQCRSLTARAVIGGETVLLVKPETYMNLSGISVRELVAEYEAKPESDLIVIQDELDFPLGTLRIHTRRSSAGHNGIESIIGALGTQDFLRSPDWGGSSAAASPSPKCRSCRRQRLFVVAHA